MRIGRLLTILVTVAALAPGRAHAGGNLQLRNPSNPSQVLDRLWDDRRLPIRWVLSRDGIPGSSIDNGTLTRELTLAFDAWESLPTSKLDFEFGGEVPIRQTGGGHALGAGIDGRNLVTFTDPEVIFPFGVLAVTITTTFPEDTVITAANADLDGDGTPDLPLGRYPAGRIFDGDIAFNSSLPWSVTGAFESLDVRAVALHEIGHLVGLCHSMVRDAVMWPFLARDVDGVGRVLKPDDVAWASFLYPDQPAYAANFGAIRGRITNGFSDAPVLGAHVYTVDPVTGATGVGTYSADDGRYVLPGLVPGAHEVAIEPLDGDPPGLDPFRINEVVAGTFDTNFPQELYDADESAVEVDPMAAKTVAVTAGREVTEVDLVTNTLAVPTVTRIFERGLNLFAYPVSAPSGLSAFDLLRAIGDPISATGIDPEQVNGIDRFVARTGAFERTQYVGLVGHRQPGGVDFPIRRGEGYLVYVPFQRVVSFAGKVDCTGTLDLAAGFNLVGVPCPPRSYTARAMLADLGSPFEVSTLERYDSATRGYQQARYDESGQPSGDDFPIVNGEGYVVTMQVPKAGLRIPSSSRAFAPVITSLSPGRGVPGTTVLITGEGFDLDPSRNLVTFNGVGAGMTFASATTLTVVAPIGATSGPVQVTVAGRPSNTVDFEMEAAVVPEGSASELVSGQAVDGSLTADGEQDRYTFTALAGSVVTIGAQALTPGVPDLVLILEDPFGAIATSDDNGGGGREPRINNFTLPTTGTYTIVVTSVPGSGSGRYHLSLEIQTRSAPTQVSLIGGNYQSALAGTTLPDPLTVLVTGPTGAPVAGIPVTLVATATTIGASSTTPQSAGEVIVATNTSGIVRVQSSLAATPGIYDIVVTVPGSAPATFHVAAIAKAVRTVTMNNDDQSGTVGQELLNPFEIVLQDAAGGFVQGALVHFQVVSGGGTITATDPTTGAADGAARTRLTLGKRASDPQVVAAFVPGRSKPLLFRATAGADLPAKMQSNKTNFTRLTLGTASLNAIRVIVTDRFDNPVPDVTVKYDAPPGYVVEAGLGPDGAYFPNMKTNADGLHVAKVSTTFTVVSPNRLRPNALPTVDEHNAPRAGGSGRDHITASLPSRPGVTALFKFDLDMGPTIVTTSTQGLRGPIGEPLPTPVEKKLFRYQRVDSTPNNDLGDEPFDLLERVPFAGAPMKVRTRRVDDESEAAFGLQPTRSAAPVATTDAGGVASVGVTLGDVVGVSEVVGEIDQLEWDAPFGGRSEHFVYVSDGRLAESTFVVGLGAVVTTTIDDSGSGIDLASVRALLNGVPFFVGATPPARPPRFPERLELRVGTRELTDVPASFVTDSAFTNLTIRYIPSRPKLVRGQNTVAIEGVRDHAGNAEPATKTSQVIFP